MTDIAGCIMRKDKMCSPLAVVFARRAEVRIGVSDGGGVGTVLFNAALTVAEARAFRSALSRAIREAEAHKEPKHEHDQAGPDHRLDAVG